MQEIKRYQIRGVPGEVIRARFAERTVDFWIPRGGSEHLLIAHDGQNVFDGKSSTHRGQTWRMAQTAINVAAQSDLKPPIVIAVWHSSTKENPWGRAQDLAPAAYFSNGEYVDPRWQVKDPKFTLQSDSYLASIFEEIAPTIMPAYTAEKTAVIGSSMGALATLYAAIKYPERFKTALALSPHWVIGDQGFADSMIGALPLTHRVWMSRGDKGLDKEYVPSQNYVDQQMRERGFTSNFSTKVYKRSGHNERSWAKYLHEPLSFWLNP